MKTTTATCDHCGRKGRTKRGNLPPDWDMMRMEHGFKTRILCPQCKVQVMTWIDGGRAA